jgi:hypothetical protein
VAPQRLKEQRVSKHSVTVSCGAPAVEANVSWCYIFLRVFEQRVSKHFVTMSCGAPAVEANVCWCYIFSVRISAVFAGAPTV